MSVSEEQKLGKSLNHSSVDSMGSRGQQLDIFSFNQATATTNASYIT